MSKWINAKGETEQHVSNLADGPQEANQLNGPQVSSETVWRNGVAAQKITPRRESGEWTSAVPERPTTGSVMSTVAAHHGGPIIGRMPNGNDRVFVDGMETRIDAAVLNGYLVRNADGSFSDAAQPVLKNPARAAMEGTHQGKPEAAGEVAGGEDFHIGEEGEAAMTSLLQGAMTSDVIRARDEILHHGGVTENTLGRMASAMNMEPSQAAEMVNAVHQGFYDTAMDHLADLGVTDEDALEAFIGANPQIAQSLPKVANDLFTNNDTSGLDALADKFMTQADRFMTEDVKAALEEAGYGWADDGQGGLRVVLAGGQQVSFEVAVKQKIITFSKG